MRVKPSQVAEKASQGATRDRTWIWSVATAVPVMATVWEKPPGWHGAVEGVTGVACLEAGANCQH